MHVPPAQTTQYCWLDMATTSAAESIGRSKILGGPHGEREDTFALHVAPTDAVCCRSALIQSGRQPHLPLLLHLPCVRTNTNKLLVNICWHMVNVIRSQAGSAKRHAASAPPLAKIRTRPKNAKMCWQQVSALPYWVRLARKRVGSVSRGINLRIPHKRASSKHDWMRWSLVLLMSHEVTVHPSRFIAFL